MSARSERRGSKGQYIAAILTGGATAVGWLLGTALFGLNQITLQALVSTAIVGVVIVGAASLLTFLTRTAPTDAGKVTAATILVSLLLLGLFTLTGNNASMAAGHVASTVLATVVFGVMLGLAASNAAKLVR
jgi:hypothetical protein